MSDMSSEILIFTTNVSPNLLNTLWRFSLVRTPPRTISIGNRNDFPKLLIMIPFKLGLFP